MTRGELFWLVVVLVSLTVRAYMTESTISKLERRIEDLEKLVRGKT
jgi:hypothetical protein